MKGTTFKVLSKKWRGAKNEFQSKRKGLLVSCFFLQYLSVSCFWSFVRKVVDVVSPVNKGVDGKDSVSVDGRDSVSVNEQNYLVKSLLVHSKGSICLEKTFGSFKWGSLLDEVEGLIVISRIWLEVGVEPWYSDGRFGVFCCDVKINCWEVLWVVIRESSSGVDIEISLYWIKLLLL